MDFLLENWMLLVIVIIASVTIALPYINQRRYGPEINHKTLTRLVNKRNAVIVDIRKPVDFKKGHIPNAINLPADQIQNHIKKLNRRCPVILVDRTGVASRTVARLLRGVGFEVYVLELGILGWQKEGLPLS